MATDVELTGVAPITGDSELPPPSIVEQWTPEQLFGFAPIPKILWNEKNRTTFWNAEISGRAFLRDGDVRVFWLHQCGLPIGISGDLADLAQRIKNTGKEKSRGNAFHSASDEPANTFTVQSPPSIWIVPREAKRIAEEAEWIAEEAERDEIIKSENSRAACDPKSIAN